jgi:hypothetical protein
MVLGRRLGPQFPLLDGRPLDAADALVGLAELLAQLANYGAVTFLINVRCIAERDNGFLVVGAGTVFIIAGLDAVAISAAFRIPVILLFRAAADLRLASSVVVDLLIFGYGSRTSS